MLFNSFDDLLIKNESDKTNIKVSPKPVIKFAKRCSDRISLTERGILYSSDIKKFNYY